MLDIIARTSTSEHSHPLDPLSDEEIKSAARIVRGQHDFGSTMRFETIVLDEPDEAELNLHEGGDPPDRRAFVATYDVATGELFEAVVSFRQEKVLSWVPRPGAKPRIGPD